MNSLHHHGIKGIKWGVRRTPEQLGHRTESSFKKKGTGKKALKTAAAVTGVVTVAAAGKYYLDHKSSIDNFISAYRKVSAYAKDRDTRAYVQSHKSEISKSASKLLKYKDYLTDKELKTAKERLGTVRELHNLRQDHIKKGAQYAQAILAYGTVASTAYGLANSQMVKDAKRKKRELVARRTIR